MVSIAYLALVREGRVAGAGQARWRGFYEFLPWEDARAGRPALVEKVIVPALERWVRQARDAETRRARRERADITFGLRGAAFDPVRVLERYELLYEAGSSRESWRDREKGPGSAAVPRLGEPMALDHRRLLATALGRLRGKLKYRPVVFELLPATFTLLRLQRVVEALAGAPAPQAELPPPRREGRPRRGHRRHRAGHRGPSRRAVPLPPRGAPRAPRAGRGPAGQALEIAGLPGLGDGPASP